MAGSWFISPGRLRELGVLGLNQRNGRFMLPNNPRRLYQRVDDKITTKELASAAGITVPETYALVRETGAIRSSHDRLGECADFVVKPSRGSGGKGIIVISEREGEEYIKPSGARVTRSEMEWHLTNILGGLFSLGGHRDSAIVEYRVKPVEIFSRMAQHGMPDIRVVLFHGYPVMAMLRLATRASDGRANLHQGAVGVGICVRSGRALHAVCRGNVVSLHPDTRFPLHEIEIPDWPELLNLAARCYDVTGLGYIGADMMVDSTHGPMLIEINARPGLSIQVANGRGLRHRLEAVAEQARHRESPETSLKRVEFSRKAFADQ